MAETTHYEWREIPYKHLMLVFPTEWIGTKLPPQWKHPLFDEPKGSDQNCYFLVELLDTYTGKVYRCPMHQFYEDSDSWSLETPQKWKTLQTHMYLQHYCTCHRKCDAREQGADCDDDCSTEEDRFVVQSITAPGHIPGVVLYSETMKELDGKTLEEVYGTAHS